MPAVHSHQVHLASLGRESPEMRLGECDSLHSCQELSIHERREQGEGVQTRARIRHVLVILVFLFQNFGFFFKILGFFFQNFEFFFFRKLLLCKCICRLFLSDECVHDFGVRHEARARRDARPFDSYITDH